LNKPDPIPGGKMVKRSAFLGFLVFVLVMMLALVAVQVARRPEAVNFFLTADTQGFLVPCGCKTVPAGGLARRATAIADFRNLCRPEPVVPIEATHGFADRGPGRELLNREMGRFFEGTGTCVGLGGYDLLLGPEALRFAAPGVDLFVAGRPAYRGSKEFRLGGWGWGAWAFGGQTLRVVFLSQTVPGGAPLADPVTILAKELRAHPGDRVMVVGQLDPETVRNLLNVEPAILMVAAQWGTSVTTLPQQAGANRWVLFLGDRGRRAATVRVAWSSGQWEVLPQIRYLGPEIPADPKVAAEVAGVIGEVEAVNERALKGLSHAPSADRAFSGASRCAPCHAEAYRRWAASPHARATSDLAIDHQEKNPECLSCHATATGRPGGYPQPTPDLSGVQCEACHGPAEGHPPKRLPSPAPSAESCGTCHTQRDSPLFDSEGYWKLVEHQ
jgi:hypothetical protein